MAFSFLFGVRPPLTPAYVARFKLSYKLTTKRAEKELGYTITPLDESIKKTIDWLEKRKKSWEVIIFLSVHSGTFTIEFRMIFSYLFLPSLK